MTPRFHYSHTSLFHIRTSLKCTKCTYLQLINTVRKRHMIYGNAKIHQRGTLRTINVNTKLKNYFLAGDLTC